MAAVWERLIKYATQMLQHSKIFVRRKRFRIQMKVRKFYIVVPIVAFADVQFMWAQSSTD